MACQCGLCCMTQTSNPLPLAGPFSGRSNKLRLDSKHSTVDYKTSVPTLKIRKL
jgi:hypothetical protein